MLGPGIRRIDDRFEVRLSPDDRKVLAELPKYLRDVLAGNVKADAWARLFPPSSDDPQIDDDYRRLIGDDLVRARLDAVEQFAQTLEGGEERKRLWTVQLDGDQAHAWLSTLNDLRLLIAPAAGIDSEDAWEAGPREESPESLLLYSLSWLEEELLIALMSSLPPTDG